jgi:hypothetical protein
MINQNWPELSWAMAGSAQVSQVCQHEETAGEIGQTNKVTRVGVQCTVEHMGETEKECGRDANKVCSASHRLIEKGFCLALLALSHAGQHMPKREGRGSCQSFKG